MSVNHDPIAYASMVFDLTREMTSHRIAEWMNSKNELGFSMSFEGFTGNYLVIIMQKFPKRLTSRTLSDKDEPKNDSNY